MPWISNTELVPEQALQYMIRLLERINTVADRLDRNVQNQLSQTAAYKQLAEEAQARATELQGTVDQLINDGSTNVELVSQLQQQVTDLQDAIDRNNDALESDDSAPEGEDEGEAGEQPVTEQPDEVPVDPGTGGEVTAPDTGQIVVDPDTGEAVGPDEGNLTVQPGDPAPGT